jgi:hypothetical protein
MEPTDLKPIAGATALPSFSVSEIFLPPFSSKEITALLG